MIEYFDRLPWDKIKQLREIAGGELFWYKRVPRLSEQDRQRFGEIVFGCPVERVRITSELNVSNGYTIPIIYAEKRQIC